MHKFKMFLTGLINAYLNIQPFIPTGMERGFNSMSLFFIDYLKILRTRDLSRVNEY